MGLIILLVIKLLTFFLFAYNPYKLHNKKAKVITILPLSSFFKHLAKKAINY